MIATGRRAIRNVLSLAALGWLAATAPAAALDAQAQMEKYVALAAKAGYTITYESIEDDGDGNFTVSGIEVTGKDMKAPGSIETLEIEGARETDDNSFIAETLSASGISYAGEDSKSRPVEIDVEFIEASGIYFPDPENADAALSVFPRSTMEIGPVSVTTDGKLAIEMAGATAVTEANADGTIFNSSGTVDGIVVNVLNIADEAMRPAIEREQIEEIELNVKLVGSWDSKSGRLELTQYTYDAPEFGKLDFTLALDGYTAELVKTLRQGAGAPPLTGPEAMNSDLGKVVMGQIRLVGGSLSYEDNSLANRVLDFQAGQMGASRQDMIDTAFGLVMGGTQMLGDPGFSLALAQAVRTFLSEPGNFTLKFAPAEPLSLGELLMTGMGDPAALIGLLGVAVSAND